jgi:hypothetical protein
MNYDDDYATCARTYAALRIFSVHISPAEITEALGVTPTAQQHRGPVENAQGQVVGMRPTAWFLSSEGQVVSKDARRHLDFVLDKLSGRALSLARLVERGARADIVCLWVAATVQAGPTLSPPQCKKLGELGIDCWFDVRSR